MIRCQVAQSLLLHLCWSHEVQQTNARKRPGAIKMTNILPCSFMVSDSKSRSSLPLTTIDQRRKQFIQTPAAHTLSQSSTSIYATLNIIIRRRPNNLLAYSQSTLLVDVSSKKLLLVSLLKKKSC